MFAKITAAWKLWLTPEEVVQYSVETRGTQAIIYRDVDGRRTLIRSINNVDEAMRIAQQSQREWDLDQIGRTW